MLCKIYRTTFEINHNRKISRAITSMQAGPMSEYDYFYDKPSVMEPLMKPYNFHFGEWELIICNFNPELPSHWTYFRHSLHCGFQPVQTLDIINEWSSDWMPKNAASRMQTSYTVYKIVDESGHIVDTRPYIDHYLGVLHEKLQKRWDSYENDPENQYARRQCFLRYPRTTNEMRQAISPEDKRWLQENGYKVKERGRRKHLPTVYDDIFLDIPRCWKDRTKQNAQYKWKRKARHKKCRGMYQ